MEDNEANIDVFGDRLALLQHLKDEEAKVEIILKNGFVCAGWLCRLENDKIRIKMKGNVDDISGRGVYVDTWPREIAAIKFEIPKNYKDLGFEPYEEKKLPYAADMPLLNSPWHELYKDKYDLLGFLYDGKRQKSVEQVEVILKGGNLFKGALEIVNEKRVLFALEEQRENNVYLDTHLSMISAVQFEIGEAGWPYDSTAC